MRLKVKKEVKEIMKTMLDAHNHVYALLKDRRSAEARVLLAQCQECAVHVGETIENSEGTEKAVSCLEEYCEHLYLMSRTTNIKKNRELKQMLDNCLRDVKKELDEKIPLDILKIVFMPYKVSMWDCMESIWEAANLDERCRAYVVPIPYYEKNPNGEIEKKCYEGESFPKYIPIIHYEKFSLEVERPDILYIHNPYDGANYVTSVQPDYYSFNLKRYVDELVYIPYFISGEGPLPESHLNLPAYKHVDKIVVQDEMHAASLNDYVEKEKIIIAGSPKIDQIIKLNKKKSEIVKYNLPKEWREKIKNKKVILFNISITGLLQNSEYVILKIKYVLSLFEERKDVVLLWRPHPLIEATLKSMRPNIYKEYMEIKTYFIDKCKGIFDETGDASIATVISDAYVGENSSSLVNYFGVLGKPVFYIDWKVLEDNRQKSRAFLYFNTFYKEEDKLFFVPVNQGLAHDLYSLDLNEKSISKVMTFPGMPDNQEMCYCGIKKILNKIFLVPHNTKDIYVYDLEIKQAIKLVLSNNASGISLFSGAIEHKNKLFFIPKCYPAIVSVDIKDLKVSEYKDCIETFLLKDMNMWMFGWAYLKKEQYLYLASCNESRILIFNLEDRSFEIKEIGGYSHGYVHMIYDGQFFWLAAGRENCVIKWDEKTGDTKKYIYPVKDEQKLEGVWSLIINNDNEIIVCYGFETEIVHIDKKTGKCSQKKVISNSLKKIRTESVGGMNSFSSVGILDKNKVIVINWENCSINIWDLQTDIWEDIPCRLPYNEMLKNEKLQMENYMLCKSVPYSLSENTTSLSQFVDYIVKGETEIFKRKYDVYSGKTDDSTVGATIHNILTSE